MGQPVTMRDGNVKPTSFITLSFVLSLHSLAFNLICLVNIYQRPNYCTSFIHDHYLFQDHMMKAKYISRHLNYTSNAVIHFLRTNILHIPSNLLFHSHYRKWWRSFSALTSHLRQLTCEESGSHRPLVASICSCTYA